VTQSELRLLGEADLDGLLRLYRQLSLGDVEVARELAVQTWRSIQGDPGLVYLGVFVDGVLVSTCHAVIVPNLTRGCRPYAVIENVVTDEAYQRRGLGALAMRGLLERCWQAGCYKVMLLSGLKRAGAHAFYQALGFDRDAKQGFVITRPSI
jgi:GNAT superfamily N-acetyltransferase